MRNDSRMEMAWRPGATKVGARGPLPSVVRRKRSGLSLRAVAPWPLRYMGQKGRLEQNSYHPKGRRRRSSSPTDACPEGSEVRRGTQTDCSSTSPSSRMPSRMLAAKYWSG